jgi:hydrogenase nickel incorporation protein HypA/HybF
MHELSLAESLVEAIEEESQRATFSRVRVVRVEAGVLSCVEPDPLRFAFEVAIQGTCAEGARLEIIRTPGKARCLDCLEEVHISAYYDPCSHCGSHRLSVLQGERFQLQELEVL